MTKVERGPQIAQKARVNTARARSGAGRRRPQGHGLGRAVMMAEMRSLVTGASGYVGSELIGRLRAGGHSVRAMAREPARVDPAILGEGAAGDRAGKVDKVEVCRGDVLSGEGLERALEGVEVAYYLIHSMEQAPSQAQMARFPERERSGAERFARAAAKAGVRRIVYLGGPTKSWVTRGATAPHNAAKDPRATASNGAKADTREEEAGPLSSHLQSREAVAEVLREAVADTVVLRASIVVGARSRSFRFMVRLIERMRVLALPAWRSYRTRPIDGRDVIEMLVAAAQKAEVAGCSLDVGGPDVLSYGEMIERIAELMLIRRPVVRVGVSVTPIAAPLAAAIAGEDPELVGALMGSLQSDLLPGGAEGNSYKRAARMLGVELHSYDAAVEHALREWEAVEPLAAR